MPDIWFPYLGFEIEHLSRVAFSIFGFDIAWYGVIIALGVVFGLLLARHLAKKSGQDPEIYVDYLIYAIIISVICARLYYIIFSWTQIEWTFAKMIDLRGGGLAIYGVVIGALLTAIVFSRKKKISLLQMIDTIVPSLALGQAMGRWGNFFNQEAFGSYTDNVFAMRLNVDTAAYTTQELLNQSVTVNGTTYIQVHPTFLYESALCLALLVLMLIVFNKRRFHGQIMCIYMIGYGIGRAFIESLRTDQLVLWSTNFPVSVLVSILMAAAGLILYLLFLKKAKAQETEENKPEHNEFAPEIDSEKSAKDEEASSETQDDASNEEDASVQSKKEETLKQEDLWE